MSQPAFKHQPLDDPAEQIRLVEVISQPDTPLELSLSIHQITQDPDYYSISYTWGDSGLTEEIIINGRPTMVTKNCHYALTHASDRYPSLPGKPIVIWIDSICTNQDDNDEKSYQVAMMGDIFTKASKVLACVGPHQDSSQMICNFLDSLMTLNPELFCHREEFTSPNSTNLFGDDPLPKVEEILQMYLQNSPASRHDFPIRIVHAFSAFANRSYWRRVWIIQKVVASTRSDGKLEILCGCDGFSRFEINICDFICRVTCPELIMDLKGQCSSMGLGLYCCRFVLGSHAAVPIPARMLLHRSTPFRCARLEDRVYGLLPLIELPKGTTPVQPMYEPSPILDLAQLFIRTMKSPSTGIWDVLNALEVYHDHKLFRPLVEARRGNPPQPLGQGQYPPLSFKLEARVTTIFLNSHGQLSANLSRNGCFPFEFMSDIKPELEGAPEGTRELFAGSEIGALLCSDAQVGDKIIEVTGIRELLVLSRSPGENDYDIVGQGLLSFGYGLPCSFPGPSAGGELKEVEAHGEGNYVSYCVLEAEPIDLIVLECQDRGINMSRIEGKKLERLATKIYGRVKLIE